MKGTRHSEEQIIAILKQGEAGSATAEFSKFIARWYFPSLGFRETDDLVG
jgi:hypothetical protein